MTLMGTMKIKPTTAGGSWSPLDLPNLMGWWDPSDTATITQTLGLVSQIDDKSGNGFHWTQGTALNQPITGTRTINSLNVLDFDGANSYMVNTISSGGADKSEAWFGIFELDATSSFSSFIGSSTNGGNDYGRDGTGIRLGSSAQTNHLTHGTTVSTATPYMFGWRVDQPGNVLAIFLNSDEDTTIYASDYNSGTRALGRRQSASDGYTDGKFGELVAVSNGNVASGDLTSLFGYFTAKWGKP